MKLKSLIIAATLLGATFYAPMAHANQKPVVESFTYTPTEVDVLSANTKVDIELIVSHPSGIDNISALLTLSSSINYSLSTYLTRIDTPVNSALTKVTFRGTLNVPRDIATGLYNFSISAIKNNLIAGYQYSLEAIDLKKVRPLIGAESGLLVRSGEELGLVYETFIGPSYNGSLGLTFKDSAKYNSSVMPIWKVGESFIPDNFYESRIPGLPLSINSITNAVCTSDGKTLKLLAEGACSFIVTTPKTKDYALKEDKQTVTVTSARIKPELTVGRVPNDTVKDLPKIIEIFKVYSTAEGYVLPTSTTPSVCLANGFYLKLVGGGTCNLTYQTKETSTYLASDLYKVTFEVVRDPQTITFTPPATANLASRTVALSATASSGGAVTYATASTGICSITGSTLNLLMRGSCAITATQAGTTTLAPISATATVMIAGAAAPSRKTIACVKGNKSKKVSGTNPKCPTGYKLKR
jgi:hypothetical protein